MEAPQQPAPKSKWKLWLKRVGFWGFMFFLVKGLVWIAVFAGLLKSCD
ncbi:MAG: alanyl-tRNA synthetase [Flavipsychrobacter sp.]|nr:alanyl-tRNA synthetase [Flavipsychrobacter sp.]